MIDEASMFPNFIAVDLLPPEPGLSESDTSRATSEGSLPEGGQ